MRIPKPRAGSDFPPFPQPRRSAEKALVAVVQEACVPEIDERLQTFPHRPIEGDWPWQAVGLEESKRKFGWSRVVFDGFAGQ